jgi:hypothetical protein
MLDSTAVAAAERQGRNARQLLESVGRNPAVTVLLFPS